MTVAHRRRTIVAFVGLAVLLASPAATAQDATPDAMPEPGVTREVLTAGLPDSAPGFALTLTRVTFDPGAMAAAHRHPGMQVIHVESGTIHTTVLSGELPYTLAGEDGQPGIEGVLVAGEEMAFEPGDRFIEPEGVVHIAENRGAETVVNLVSSLVAVDQPVTIPVDDQATPAS